MSRKYVYDFEEGDWRNKKLLGGKGSSLAQMTQLNFPVPPGFTISTDACIDFYKPVKDKIDNLIRELARNPPPEKRDKIIREIWDLINKLDLPDGLMDEVRLHMDRLAEKMGRRFGDKDNPLLVSVRSGAAVSMPGMMDTILNLGLNDDTVKGLAKQTSDERFAYDAYRRFLQMFGRIALEIDEKLFDEALEEIKREYNAKYDVEIPVEGLKKLVERYK
ncbi:pyruvate, phosphate dikinase, partial [Candidatus Geothermarchaeota archaeon]